MLNLDTHILLYALAGQLSTRERQLLETHRWTISQIVSWELCKLAQLGRIELDFEDPTVERALRRIHTWPLSWEVCRASCQLDIASDPADELIAATSLVHDVPLLTRDRTLRASAMIPLAD